MCACVVESDGGGARGRMMPAFSNQKVANHIIHLHTMLRFLSVSRHLIYQYRYIPQEGNICPINQNYGRPGPSLLWYRHFFPERHSVGSFLVLCAATSKSEPKSRGQSHNMYGGLSLTAEKAAAEPTKREIRASFIFAGGY